MIGTIIIFAAVISLLIFVHELGHFITAKKIGVRVDEFGFGFPPRIAGIKKGDTIYSVNWIPLGGFVKIKGESGEHGDDPDSFSNKKLWQRGLILSAGVIMNFALAWFLLSVGYVIGLPQVTDGLSEYARISEEKIQVLSVLEGTPADNAAILPGDTILSIDGIAMGSIEEFSGYTSGRESDPVTLRVQRDGEEIEKKMVPAHIEEIGGAGIGVALVSTGFVSYPVWLAPIEALNTTVYFTKQVFWAFGTMISDLFFAKEVSIEFSGPVGIAVITAKVASHGIRHLLQFTALLSVNLAIINILPIPALDGGRLLFLFMEGVRGRAIGRKIEVSAHNIGFVLLILLVLAVTYRDVVRFGDAILNSVFGLFG